MSFQFTTFTRDTDDPRIATLTVYRPDALNALSTAVLIELQARFDEIARLDDLSVLVLTGFGKAFVAGADIAEMHYMNPTSALAFSHRGQHAFARLAELQLVSIAAVNGFALGGGCELALACDLRVASDKAKFGQPEVNLGLIPGFGGTQRLARVVGPGRALAMILTGDPMNAEEARTVGLVTEVFPAAELQDKALDLARKITAKGPSALRAVKRAVREGWDLPLHEGIALEAKLFAHLFETGEPQEGMGAFLEKRSANFVDKKIGSASAANV